LRYTNTLTYLLTIPTRSLFTLVSFEFLGRIADYADAAYCYRPSSVVCQSVWTDRDAVWIEDLGGPKEARKHVLGCGVFHFLPTVL